MKIRIIVLLSFFGLTSCATLFSKKEYPLHIRSNVPNAKITLNDSVYELPATVTILRAKKDLPILLTADSIRKNFTLKASPSPRFVFGNLPFIYLWPIAYGIDYTNPKRFYYGKNIFLDSNDSSGIILPPLSRSFHHFAHDYFKNAYPGKKGQVNFIAGSAFANFIHVDNAYKQGNKFALGGIKTGLEYFYKNNRYISLMAIQTSAFDGFPAEYFGSYTQTSSSYIGVTDNYAVNRFTLGYGLSYSLNTVRVVEEIPNSADETETKYRNQTLGLSFNSHLRFYKSLFVGVTYRPNFWLVKPESEFRYEHLVSIEFVYKLRIKK